MDVLQRIKGILVSDLLVDVPPERMEVDDSLRDVYGLDSLGYIELRVCCEQIFGVTIDDDDFSPENFSTLGGVEALVRRLLREKETVG
ncbi:coronafacic acid synthetase [Actinomadura sp. CNU-125]|uniref:acyl carrier protein n=1 Tax=Actinomadura sp. CNU-125 TaxID=1904961 RepID=UPI00096810F7|nr:acyl carrier protein [Actinomadura sp. CNU-125]OLT10693.1 coronafacic acid synthetase [Actinomadura sp. CNU-125]